jgi:hypothetical protein
MTKVIRPGSYLPCFFFVLHADYLLALQSVKIDSGEVAGLSRSPIFLARMIFADFG